MDNRRSFGSTARRSAFSLERGRSALPADWRWLIHSSRPNGLIVGPKWATAAVLQTLEPSLCRPLLRWPRDPAPWSAGHTAATVVLHDVLALTPTEQLSLLTWMNEAERHVQVVSIATRRVYPFVRDQSFMSALYYRLNCVYVDCFA